MRPLTERQTGRTALWLTGLLILGATALCLHGLLALLPWNQWPQALWHPDMQNLPQVLFHERGLPRIGLAWLCGMALGLAGAATQQITRNPLAEPMTLGIFPGAYLALLVGLVFFPDLTSAGRDGTAFIGALAAMGLVVIIASRDRLSPLAMILAGMILTICCGAISMTLALLFYDKIDMALLWCGGSLDHASWAGDRTLLWRLLPCGLALLLCHRPLHLLSTGEQVAQSLGVRLSTLRLTSLTLVLLITAFIASAVGIVGFIGLGAPWMARLLGARRLMQRLVLSALLGALLLWLADGLAQWLSLRADTLVPAGALTAFFGAPLLLVLIPRLRRPPQSASGSGLSAKPPTARGLRVRVGLTALALAMCLFLALFVARDPLGRWHIDSGSLAQSTWFLREPRLVAALALGALLAIAGSIMQFMSANPMASPDLLGITSGGMLGMTAALFLPAYPTIDHLWLASTLGAGGALLVLLAFGRRNGFAPEPMLLVGVTLSALTQSVYTLALTSASPRVGLLLSLLTGSTYYVNASQAALVAFIALVALLATPAWSRWLQTLPLGQPVATALGVQVPQARLVLLIVCAALTAAATLLIGPLSFVGLIAPHITRLTGIRRPTPLLLTAATLGAILMAFSDWLGRWIIAPHEIAAGVMASLIGAVYLVVTMTGPRQALSRHP